MDRDVEKDASTSSEETRASRQPDGAQDAPVVGKGDDGGEGRDNRRQDDDGSSEVFEVGWDGGDADPLNPRSFNTARKWLIVSIVSICAFCW